MTTHVTDEDLAAVVAGLEVTPEAHEHLSSCLSCRQEVAELQKSIAERRREMEAEIPDWQRQRNQVMARLADRPQTGSAPSRRWLRPLLAAAAVALVAVGVGLFMPPGATTPPTIDDLAVEQILAEVDAVLADDSLPGFEFIDPGVDDPAGLVADGAS